MENQDLQALFDEFVRTGNQSLVDALKVGAKIKELDIKDLEAAIANTENGDLTTLYTRLIMASENHLRAFIKNLNKQGIAYILVILSGKQYDTIVGTVIGKNDCFSGEKAKSNCKGGSGKKKDMEMKKAVAAEIFNFQFKYTYSKKCVKL